MDEEFIEQELIDTPDVSEHYVVVREGGVWSLHCRIAKQGDMITLGSAGWPATRIAWFLREGWIEPYNFTAPPTLTHFVEVPVATAEVDPVVEAVVDPVVEALVDQVMDVPPTRGRGRPRKQK